MYGTVARLRLKPGAEARMMELSKQFEKLNIPGYIGQYVYRMDADSNEYMLVVQFTDKDAYFANANNPEQDARFRQMMEMLEKEPDWNDGEVVYSFTGGNTRA